MGVPLTQPVLGWRSESRQSGLCVAAMEAVQRAVRARGVTRAPKGDIKVDLPVQCKAGMREKVQSFRVRNQQPSL
jgi:hypothetical protein